MELPTNAAVRKAMSAKGYAIPFAEDLQLFGIRSKDTKPNRFDDWVGAFYQRVALGVLLVAAVAVSQFRQARAERARTRIAAAT